MVISIHPFSGTSAPSTVRWGGKTPTLGQAVQTFQKGARCEHPFPRENVSLTEKFTRRNRPIGTGRTSRLRNWVGVKHRWDNSSGLNKPISKTKKRTRKPVLGDHLRRGHGNLGRGGVSSGDTTIGAFKQRSAPSIGDLLHSRREGGLRNRK